MYGPLADFVVYLHRSFDAADHDEFRTGGEVPPKANAFYLNCV